MAVLTVLTALGAGLTACSELANGAGQISQRIGALTHDPQVQQVDLAALTSFGWQRFFLLPAGTSREAICTLIGANRHVCGRVIRYLAVPPGHVALFFHQDGQLTHTELHDLANGTFELAAGPPGCAKEAARFRIQRLDRDSGAPRILLTPI